VSVATRTTEGTILTPDPSPQDMLWGVLVLIY